ncbi:hypothetical protein [Photorhabdus sp. SF281]|uniref:hypothetical protein n=1 Tax=Photorhabdus sp. SF281 TaxID=3459527 RepID=UPI004044D5F8
MSFQGGINIKLAPANATQMTVDLLSAQLTELGLTCNDASRDKLQGYINDVRYRFRNGTAQAFFLGNLDQDLQEYKETSTGVWKPLDDPPERNKLLYLCNSTHYNWLKSNDPDFEGSDIYSTSSKKSYKTVEGVKEAFYKTGDQISQQLVNGLDPKSTESKLTNTLANAGGDGDNWDSDWQEDAILIALDYNTDTHNAGGIGFIGLKWRIIIKDYKGKTKNHETLIALKTWSNTYTELDDLLNDYNKAHNQFG